MRTVIIDGEKVSLNEILFYLRKYNAEILGTFTSPFDGYEFVILTKPDVVFLAVEMPLLNGLELGIKIRAQMPKISIVYISAHPQYALESFRVHPVDYILQPIDENRLLNTVEHIRCNIGSDNLEPLMTPHIQCFSKFQVLVQHEEIRFATQKVRELLAFLLCHYNKPIYKDDLVNSIFNSGDEKKDLNNLRVSLYRLRHTLMESKITKEHLLIKDEYSVLVADGVCDLVDYINFMDNNKVIDESNIARAQEIVDSLKDELFSDLDTAWVMDMREYYNVQIEELMVRMAQYYMESGGNNKKAERILIKLIEKNDLSEQGYALLLDLYMKAGKKERYIHLYRRYAKILKVDLDSTPEREYTEYYIKCKNE